MSVVTHDVGDSVWERGRRAGFEAARGSRGPRGPVPPPPDPGRGAEAPGGRQRGRGHAARQGAAAGAEDEGGRAVPALAQRGQHAGHPPGLPAQRPRARRGPPGRRGRGAPRPLGCRPQAARAPEADGPRAAPGRRVQRSKAPEEGCPKDAVDVDAVISRVEATFSQFPHERATMDDMGQVAKACGCPLYWKGPLFYSAGGERTGHVSVHRFIAMWRKVLQSCHDDAARFTRLLVSPGSEHLVQEDFVPFVQDVVNTHPGLAFLKDAPEFHSRYITTVSHLPGVIQRIFYTVNRSWSGRITCTELRKSSFLQNVALLEEEADINQLTEFFSYEHFYVIYCKFWELDTDHDLFIDSKDLARHNDHAISTKMIDRIFSGAVTRGKRVQKEGKLSYADFVWFLISEEDKKTPTSIEYWFRCMDLDGDGTLSMYELEFFYEEQSRRLDSMAIEALPFEDCLCQMLDLVRPQSEGKITLQDLKKCKQANVFFDTFFNIEKYLDHEQKEQMSLLREGDSDGPELSDWEKYAAEEYDILVAEEAAGDSWDDGFEAELSPVDAKLSGRHLQLDPRPFLEAPSALGAVDLFDYECEDELQLL
ncbi:serine/threonine-protein phosphatase 2A regulatory subunit B'' subunit beta-like isoform X5 [Choloepus didactylus]|uniref:serine/threonine-protein phosphatase 2A regulatory subunit B'' subunit beta-like isoform X5 n=1 Tax=Choloepus didactylus TaxID=27675 RepID=UPI00189F2C76|nr:serine/threonine-protein phosphatase 2A regulatory subunit B'' subunit beta-like isoform X5 [Choloepus didactylus]